MRGALAWIVLLLVAAGGLGCEVDIPQGRIACAGDGECPRGWACVSSRCYRERFDAGEGVDGATADAGRDAGGLTDGGSVDAEVADAGGCAPGYLPSGEGCERDCSIRACASPFDSCPTDTCKTWHLFSVPWSALTSCSPSSWKSLGQDGACIEAADAWCRTQAGPGWLGGVGPVAEVGGQAQILCGADPVEVLRSLTAAALSTFGACSDSDLDACFATVWTFCDFGGDWDEGGRLLRVRSDTDGDIVEMMCLNVDTSTSVTITMEAAAELGCDIGSPSTRRALSCLAAAHTLCVDNDYYSGIGVRVDDPSSIRIQCAFEPSP